MLIHVLSHTFLWGLSQQFSSSSSSARRGKLLTWDIYFLTVFYFQTVTADIVVLGAGTLGSTEILLRSQRQHNLRLSPQLGKGFSGNGDQLGISYNADNTANSFGVRTKFNPKKTKPPGPTITSMIDFRNTQPGTGPWNRGFVMQDGTPAVSMVTALKAMLCLSPIIGIDPDHSDDWEQLANKILVIFHFFPYCI